MRLRNTLDITHMVQLQLRRIVLPVNKEDREQFLLSRLLEEYVSGYVLIIYFMCICIRTWHWFAELVIFTSATFVCVSYFISTAMAPFITTLVQLPTLETQLVDPVVMHTLASLLPVAGAIVAGLHRQYRMQCWYYKYLALNNRDQIAEMTVVLNALPSLNYADAIGPLLTLAKSRTNLVGQYQAAVN